MRGERRASELLNFVDELETPFAGERDYEGWLDVAEAYLYAVEEEFPKRAGKPSAVDQLRRKAQGEELTRPKLLSNRTGRSENKRAVWLLEKIESDLSTLYGRSTLEYLDSLLDFKKPSIM